MSKLGSNEAAQLLAPYQNKSFIMKTFWTGQGGDTGSGLEEKGNDIQYGCTNCCIAQDLINNNKLIVTGCNLSQKKEKDIEI